MRSRGLGRCGGRPRPSRWRPGGRRGPAGASADVSARSSARIAGPRVEFLARGVRELERCSAVTWCQTSPCSYHSSPAARIRVVHRRMDSSRGPRGPSRSQVLRMARLSATKRVCAAVHARGAAEGGGLRLVDAGPPVGEVAGAVTVEAGFDGCLATLSGCGRRRRRQQGCLRVYHQALRVPSASACAEVVGGGGEGVVGVRPVGELEVELPPLGAARVLARASRPACWRPRGRRRGRRCPCGRRWRLVRECRPGRETARIVPGAGRAGLVDQQACVPSGVRRLLGGGGEGECGAGGAVQEPEVRCGFGLGVVTRGAASWGAAPEAGVEASAAARLAVW